MISQGFLGNLGSIKSTPQSYVQAYSSTFRTPRNAASMTCPPGQDLLQAVWHSLALAATSRTISLLASLWCAWNPRQAAADAAAAAERAAEARRRAQAQRAAEVEERRGREAAAQGCAAVCEFVLAFGSSLDACT